MSVWSSNYDGLEYPFCLMAEHAGGYICPTQIACRTSFRICAKVNETVCGIGIASCRRFDWSKAAIEIIRRHFRIEARFVKPYDCLSDMLYRRYHKLQRDSDWLRRPIEEAFERHTIFTNATGRYVNLSAILKDDRLPPRWLCEKCHKEILPRDNAIFFPKLSRLHHDWMIACSLMCLRAIERGLEVEKVLWKKLQNEVKRAKELLKKARQINRSLSQ